MPAAPSRRSARSPMRSDLRSERVPQHDGLSASASARSEEHTSELQSRSDLVCRLLLEKKKKKNITIQKRRRTDESCEHTRAGVCYSAFHACAHRTPVATRGHLSSSRE